MKIGKHFTLIEFTRSDKAKQLGIDNTPNAVELGRIKLVVEHILDPLRDATDAITPSSGFRGHRLNSAVGGEPTSQHRLGEAVDFSVKGMTSDQVVRKIIEMKLPFDQLIEEFGRWVHVSYGPRNRREVLRAVKRIVNGKEKTVYIPFT